MIWGRVATTRLETTPRPTPARVQSAPLRRSVMVLTTWREMSASGVGTGMERRMLGGLIRKVQRQARTACFGAAVGATMWVPAGRPTATTSALRSGTTSWGSVAPAPQVSELSSQSGAVEAEREPSNAPDCGARAKEQPAQRSRYVARTRFGLVRRPGHGTDC